VYVKLPSKYFVLQTTLDIVVSLGMVSRETVPLTAVDVSVVDGMAPAAEIDMDFTPLVPWLTVTVFSIALTQPLSVIDRVLVSVIFVPLIVIAKLPCPDVSNPVLFRL
jgi:hypothetical protein